MWATQSEAKHHFWSRWWMLCFNSVRMERKKVLFFFFFCFPAKRKDLKEQKFNQKRVVELLLRWSLLCLRKKKNPAASRSPPFLSVQINMQTFPLICPPLLRAECGVCNVTCTKCHNKRSWTKRLVPVWIGRKPRARPVKAGTLLPCHALNACCVFTSRHSSAPAAFSLCREPSARVPGSVRVLGVRRGWCRADNAEKTSGGSETETDSTEFRLSHFLGCCFFQQLHALSWNPGR